MNVVISSQVVLARAPEGPLAPHIASFAESLSALGYVASSVHRQVRIAAGFSRWLGQQGVALGGITSDQSVRYLRSRARRLRPCRGDLAALAHVIDFLRREELVPAEKIAARQLTPIDGCAESA